jgi:carboxylate-amine ligase
MGAGHPYGLFERIGIELEYMVVDAGTLDVLPVTDRVLRAQCGSFQGEVPVGPVTWSNELVLHVIELKTTEPAESFAGWDAAFQDHAGRINAILARGDELDAPPGRLLPTGMHPWMDPWTQTRLWPHDTNEVYEAFNRIFDCRGHGWANLQSVHVNLPFRDDDSPESEFGRLHAAIRLLLPIMPALSASSPFMEGRATGTLDNRLAVYMGNARRIPSVTGRVVPEQVWTRREYEHEILGRIYADLAPLDPSGVLRHEWANARGAIARFDRGTIEVRVLDVQECPAADLAVVGAIVAVLKALVAERWRPLGEQQSTAVEPLARLLETVIADGERAVINDTDYLGALGWPGSRCTAGELWRHLVESTGIEGAGCGEPLGVILDEGPLARRILRAAGQTPDRARLREVYTGLADCLRDGKMFRATP